MHALCRPLLRTLAPRNVPLSFLAKPSPIGRPLGLGLARNPILIRNIASSVTNQPGSQSIEHAATNVKEEIGNSTKDLAKVIAGANVTTDAVSDSSADSFIGITTSIASQVPQPLMVLGLTGGLPYISASLTTIYAAYKANLAATAGVVAGMDPNLTLTVLHQALNFQVTYGAVMLSFLGALHWGMEIAGYGGHKGYARLGLGAAPMLVSWSTLAMEPMSALIVQWAGFTGLWYADSKATIAGWAPKWYSQYRFYLSVLVGTCIIGSLAGTSYYGATSSRGLLSNNMEELREERVKHPFNKRGLIPGSVEAVPAPADSDHYTRIHNQKADQEKH